MNTLLYIAVLAPNLLLTGALVYLFLQGKRQEEIYNTLTTKCITSIQEVAEKVCVYMAAENATEGAQAIAVTEQNKMNLEQGAQLFETELEKMKNEEPTKPPAKGIRTTDGKDLIFSNGVPDRLLQGMPEDRIIRS